MTSESMYELVIANGRVIDPDSGLDAVRNVGIAGGRVQAISESTLHGRDTLDAGGLVVAPGFIDLHSHGQNVENYEMQARDGVTTALELEVGIADFDAWYGERRGNAAINFGASAGHIPVRMKVMNDPGAFLPTGDAAHRQATADEISQMKSLLSDGLNKGALAMGFGIDYTRGASRWEIVEMFQVAADHGASCHVHLRGKGHMEPGGAIEAFEEVLAVAAVTGAPLHVVHVQSTGMRATAQVLHMVQGAQQRGLDVTTECYPYAAGMTRIESALFDDGWQEQYGISYENLQRPDTGEFLTASTFAQYREEGGWIIAHSTPQDDVDVAVTSPLTIIATDGIMNDGKGHPRTAGSYSLVLGRYVRERKLLSLTEAIAKMTIMPAKRLENRATAFKNKGRIKAGADADITIFDPATVIDRSTYEQPTLPPVGMRHVLVGGHFVVRDGQLQAGATPGQGILAL
ncbi:MAG: amidohydrolase family protein [Chloroflexi bacterium]|nr:amidohydrolase family protein [Chloroflexota bacterium]